MNVSPSEAEEALAAIQSMAQKTRHSLASSGASTTLIATGLVWLVGFLATQFLQGQMVAYIWIGLSLLGSALGIILGIRRSKRVRSPSSALLAGRILLFWLFIIIFGVTAILVARPADEKQVAMLVILFIMLGQLAMGLLFSFASVWWALPVTALALIGYYFLPGIFYLWMAILGGGGMMLLGVYIRLRW